MENINERKHAFLQRIMGSDFYYPLSSGIKPLDDILGGGFLRQSVVGVMGVPGVGKTTICQQMAEAFARQNRHVLYANFDMSHDIMIARSISRHLKNNGCDLSPIQILQFYKRSDDDKKLILSAIDDYFTSVDKLVHYDVIQNTDINAVDRAVRQWCNDNRNAIFDNPIVIIDYLHKLTLVDGAGRIVTDNGEKIARSMDIFRKMSEDLETTVVVISAINRMASSTKEINLFSARDSSNIEYGVDTMIALNKADEFGSSVDFTVLKNRLGGLNTASIYFDGEHATFGGDEE